MTWPTLIGSSTAAVGLAIAAFPLQTLLQHGTLPPVTTISGIATLLVLVAVLGFIALSIFIFRASFWARRALVATLLCFVLAVILEAVSTEVHSSARDRLTRIAVYIMVTVPPLFMVGVLWHPDVARAFPRRQTATANEPLAKT